MGRPVVVDCLDLKTTIAKDGSAGVYKSGQWTPVAPGSKVPEKLILGSEFQLTASAMTLQRRLRLMREPRNVNGRGSGWLSAAEARECEGFRGVAGWGCH
jgi:hypothetical protein